MSTPFESLLGGLRDGRIVPYLGPGALKGSVHPESGEPIPADSDSLIYAMNNGQAMAPRLMYEFPRAAMNLELKRGRSFITRFMNQLYGETAWSTPALYQWLAEFTPPYVIDTNRDTLLQQAMRDRPHTLVCGVARIGGTDYRFKIYQWENGAYREIQQEEVDKNLPTLFKPLGTPLPEANFIVSDADFVDYITELMGGFAIPGFLKEYRPGKQYLLLGLRLTRDTERMVLTDTIYGAGEPTGWALIPEPTDKERRFCARQKLEIIQADIPDLLRAAGVETAAEQAA